MIVTWLTDVVVVVVAVVSAVVVGAVLLLLGLAVLEHVALEFASRRYLNRDER